MKLLLYVGFLVISLSYGVVQPMESFDLTCARGESYSADELTDLGLAISGKSLKAILTILNRNQACVNQEVKSGAGIFPLEYAFSCHGGDKSFMASVVQELLSAGADLSLYKNFSALHYAAGYGYLDLFNRLLQAGADISALTPDGASVAHCAVGMYKDMKQAPVSDVEKRRKSLSLSGSSGDLKERLSIFKAADLGEGTVLKSVQLCVSQDPIISRLEMLKIFFIDNQVRCVHDQYGKFPQAYAQNDLLCRFLDGITQEDKKHDMRLYEEIRSEIAGELISPRTPRTPGRSKLRGSSLVSVPECLALESLVISDASDDTE
ncbi:hypothetical protein JST56_03060 [Candidatus Dependentiae bacterium]|jgi:hypothetical protein|nr:hypothetical protein [Candidatus Dependentiae bacterium]